MCGRKKPRRGDGKHCVRRKKKKKNGDKNTGDFQNENCCVFRPKAFSVPAAKFLKSNNGDHFLERPKLFPTPTTPFSISFNYTQKPTF